MIEMEPNYGQTGFFYLVGEQKEHPLRKYLYGIDISGKIHIKPDCEGWWILRWGRYHPKKIEAVKSE